MSNSAKDQRLNLRVAGEALSQIKRAAQLSQQDVTSFVLGAALDRSRAVLAEDQFLRLTPDEVVQIEAALDAEPKVIPELAALIRRVAAGQTTVHQSA